MNDKRLPGVMRGVSPCTDCAERHTACHDTCSQYKEWKAKAQKIKEARLAYLDERTKAYEEQKRRNRWGRTITKQD